MVLSGVAVEVHPPADEVDPRAIPVEDHPTDADVTGVGLVTIDERAEPALLHPHVVVEKRNALRRCGSGPRVTSLGKTEVFCMSNDADARVVSRNQVA